MSDPRDPAQMSPQQIIAYVERYNRTEHVWPLHCSLFTSHPKLEPREEEGKVVLFCPQQGCGFVQRTIPDVVFGVAAETVYKAQEFMKHGKGLGDGET